MALVDEFLHRHFSNHSCDYCSRFFPASALITLPSPFEEIAGKYCAVCYHKIYDLIGYCDACCEEYPKSHLYQSLISKEKYCRTCLREELSEYENEELDC